MFWMRGFVKNFLPAAWDALMAERGYQPLSSFYLKSDLRPDRPRPLPKGYSRPGVRGDRQEGSSPRNGYSRSGAQGNGQDSITPQGGKWKKQDELTLVDWKKQALVSN